MSVNLTNAPGEPASTNASGVDVAFANGNSRLAEAAWFLVEFDERRLIACVGRLGIHNDDIIPPDSSSPARGPTAEARVPRRVARPEVAWARGGGDWVEKLPIDEHLGPMPVLTISPPCSRTWP